MTNAGERGSDAAAVSAAAAALLARRDYPRARLEARLVDKGFDAATIAACLDTLVAQRVIDDARYAERYVAYHAGQGRGPERMRRELLEQGVAEMLIHEALGSGHDWPALARAQRQRKFGSSPPGTWAEKARQARFLQYRGFSPDHIRSALRASDLD
jgi:regulatory protein